MDLWDRELEVRNPEEHARWKQKTGITPENKYGFYSHYYARRFARDDGKRYRDGSNFLERMMEKARPSCGYVYLSLLMAENFHNVVITTNFDHLTEDCLVQYAQTMPMVIGHERLAPYATRQISRPTVIKIHRDLLLSPINDPEELSHLHENWKAVLENVFSTYHPLFLGYAGNDQSVMDFLCLEENMEKFRTGAWACPYWFLYGDKAPTGRVREFLEGTGGYLIHHGGFDQVLIRLCDALDIHLPEEEAFLSKIREQYKALLDSADRYISESTPQAGSAPISTPPPAETPGCAARESAEPQEPQEDNAGAYSQFLTLFARQDYPAALTLITGLTERVPDDPRYHSGAGVTLHALGRYEEAEAEKRKAVELDPGQRPVPRQPGRHPPRAGAACRGRGGKAEGPGAGPGQRPLPRQPGRHPPRLGPL